MSEEAKKRINKEKYMGKIILKVPTKEEIKYRQFLMQDKETMEYNAGYNIDLKGYDYETGCIYKTDIEMQEWYDKWIGKDDRYYAYIVDKESNENVGEIYFYKDDEVNAYSMGIVIEAKYRGKGYSKEALIELKKVAFEKYNVNALSDQIPKYRVGALRVFEDVGFIKTDRELNETRFGKESIVYEMRCEKGEG